MACGELTRWLASYIRHDKLLRPEAEREIPLIATSGLGVIEALSCCKRDELRDCDFFFFILAAEIICC